MADALIEALAEAVAALLGGIAEIDLDDVVLDILVGISGGGTDNFSGGELTDLGKSVVRDSIQKFSETHTTEQIHDLARKTRRAAEALHKKLENKDLSPEQRKKIEEEEKIINAIAKEIEIFAEKQEKAERKLEKKLRKQQEEKLESIKPLSNLSSEEIEKRIRRILKKSPGAAPIFLNKMEYDDLLLALPIAKERERLQSIESERQRTRTIELQLARTAAWEKLQREQAAEALRRQVHEERVAAAQSQYGSSFPEDAARLRQRLGLPPKRVPLGQGLSNAAMLRMSPILESLPSPTSSLAEKRGSASPEPQRTSPLLAPLSRASPSMEEERGSASPGPPKLAPLNYGGSRSISGGSRSISGGSAAAGGGGGGQLSPVVLPGSRNNSGGSAAAGGGGGGQLAPIPTGHTVGNVRAQTWARLNNRGFTVVTKR